MDYKNNSNTGLIIVADCMLLSVEYIGNVHLFFNTSPSCCLCYFIAKIEIGNGQQNVLHTMNAASLKFA